MAVAQRVLIAAQNGAVEADAMFDEFSEAEKIEVKQSGRSLDNAKMHASTHSFLSKRSLKLVSGEQRYKLRVRCGKSLQCT